MSAFLLHSWRAISPDGDSHLTVLWSQNLKGEMLLSSGLQGPICHHWCSSHRPCIVSLWPLSILAFVSSFQKFNYVMSWTVISFSFPIWVLLSFLNCRSVFCFLLLNLGTFLSHYLKFFSFLFHLLSSPLLLRTWGYEC